jgi:hypothetical protein
MAPLPPSGATGHGAMGRLDAILGRPPLDAPDDTSEAPEEPALWLDEEPGTAAIGRVQRHKGAHKGAVKGASGGRRATERPDPTVDRAQNEESGTAYRIPGETSHASQPRTPSTSKRRMRRMRQQP